MGTDEKGWWLNGHLPFDEGALVERAIRTAREDLYRQSTKNLPDGTPRPQVNLADGLIAIAETALQTGQNAHPASDRYIIYAHLETRPGDPTSNLASLHLGPILPDHLRQLHTCDATLRPVLEQNGVPYNIGQDKRIVPQRLRRLIEHRNHGCQTPGCHRTHHLEIHHITHWENGGKTTTDNLIALCTTHHRAHHNGLLTITGNPNLTPHTPGALTFTDKWGRTLQPTGTPTTPNPHIPLHETAQTAGITPTTYNHPLGEHLDPTAITLHPNPPTAPPSPPHDLTHGPPGQSQLSPLRAGREW